jgi:hypothetical protein
VVTCWFVPWQFTMLFLLIAAPVGAYAGWTLWELRSGRRRDKK